MCSLFVIKGGSLESKQHPLRSPVTECWATSWYVPSYGRRHKWLNFSNLEIAAFISLIVSASVIILPFISSLSVLRLAISSWGMSLTNGLAQTASNETGEIPVFAAPFTQFLYERQLHPLLLDLAV